MLLTPRSVRLVMATRIPMRCLSLAPALAGVLAVVVALGLAGCGGRPGSAPPPVVAETPPTTKDPGAVIDEPPLRPSPPPRPENGGILGAR